MSPSKDLRPALTAFSANEHAPVLAYRDRLSFQIRVVTEYQRGELTTVLLHGVTGILHSIKECGLTAQPVSRPFESSSSCKFLSNSPIH